MKPTIRDLIDTGAAGRTQQQIAAEAGLNRRAVSDLVHGCTRRPQARTVSNLAAVLGQDPVAVRAAIVESHRRRNGRGSRAQR